MVLLFSFQGWSGSDPCDSEAGPWSMKAGGNVCLLGGFLCAKGDIKADGNGVNMKNPRVGKDYKAFMDAAKDAAEGNFKFKTKVGAKAAPTICYSF